MRAEGFYWVRARHDRHLTIAEWDPEQHWWNAVGYIECRPDEDFEVVSERLTPPEVKP